MTPEQEKLITDNIKLVYFVYNKSFSAKDDGREKEELIAEGMLGLTKAAVKYDVTRGVATFATFACKCIWQQMCKYLRDNKARLTTNIVSIDAEVKSVEGGTLTIQDLVAGQEEEVQTEKQIFDELILSDREREILTYRYMGYTMDEIASMLGLSRQRVNMIIAVARNRYRRGGRIIQGRGRPKKEIIKRE